MSASDERDSYLLGMNRHELERLKFQHSVWGHIIRKFFDRLKMQKGWRCLNVGAGPGLVSFDLRELVGEKGAITALEPSQFYLDCLKHDAEGRGWKNVECVHGAAENAILAPRSYDLVFVRWVIAFVPDPERFLPRSSIFCGQAGSLHYKIITTKDCPSILAAVPGTPCLMSFVRTTGLAEATRTLQASSP
jgi:SAM-dependent methyltransferase